ncbi:hypothetical protein [Xylocopilactobacillus apicola]|uniref:Uncharacterized protein n=1 Tax=Xylocopilactobacillus apicola TaxID=2932184 RepID=A0AAU9D9G2_9LACO|nr:hypothetical protein [Xylocopilactobacillus apicola]BDR59051.1 hypothetical protein XA3_14920 [Xylocopilactobacillus apicola]
MVLNLLTSPASDNCYKNSISFLKDKSKQFEDLIKFYQDLNSTTKEIMEAVKDKKFERADQLLWSINCEDE